MTKFGALIGTLFALLTDPFLASAKDLTTIHIGISDALDQSDMNYSERFKTFFQGALFLSIG